MPNSPHPHDRDGRYPLPVLRFDEAVKTDPDLLAVCRIFRLDPTRTSFDLTTANLDPYPKDAPKEGLTKLDLETRSLLQVLFFVANSVDAPHAASGIAPQTAGPDGAPFDWNQVTGGLFKVYCAEGNTRPRAPASSCGTGVLVYIDERDRDTKAAFELLVELPRLQLSTDKGGAAPILTRPLGGR